MTVVTLTDFTPIPRYDDKPWWWARVEEAPTAEGPWTQIEQFVLDPTDTDPTQPMTRSFTTELATLGEGGWYRIIFADQTDDLSFPTEPIQNVPKEAEPYMPLVSEVAAQIMSRTKDKYGVEVGTFTQDTRPSYNKVSDIIDQAADDVTTIIDTDIPEGAYSYVREAIAIRAAMIIERSYYSDQVDTGRSVYEHLRDEWLRLIGTSEEPGSLVNAMERETDEAEFGESTGGNAPRYSFPEANPYVVLGRPL